MEIGQPYYLFALLLVPAVVYLFVRYLQWRKSMLYTFGDWNLVSSLVNNSGSIRPFVKLLPPLLALVLIIVALSGIRSGNARRMIRHEGIDLAIVLDVSNSMLATDEMPDRLATAKQFCTELITQLPDARIAVLAFAGLPVLQTPITIDHAAVQLALSASSVAQVPEQGSDIGSALLEAIHALPENQQHYRAVVLVSDGEDHEGNVQNAIQALKKERIVVCTAGIGSEAGATIPLVSDGIVTMKKDRQGKTIISVFQDKILRDIANNCNGVYAKAEGGDNSAANAIANHLDRINKNQFDEELLVPLESRFQWFLFPALVLLVVDFFISKRKMKWLRKRKTS